ncbi:ABC transporter permease [Kineosporia succinea]|uniref:ABC-2 type transport system permease protein n=1 Tax=Kineosporia succinea TaxID=84632 RepID=A0ABT9P2S8_9ACTN|nr:ABC transporter permease [Kineosporia succinea]MDP9826968.1 ABC-2 type transport system permease protein [Kineosporia succinea]
MPATGHSEGLEGLSVPSAPAAADGAAPGYSARRTLSLRVEARRQLTRRRTQISLGFLVALPFILVAAFSFGEPEGRNAQTALVDLATSGAANFTVFTLFVSSGFLLVVIVALFAGDTVASEASWSSLRYLLAIPVPRAALLRRKLLVALGYCAFALVLLPVVSYVVGGVFYGWAPLKTPLGGSISGSELAVRLVVAVGYIMVSLLFVAALAFLVGVYTDAPLGAVGGAVMLVILSNILDTITALGDWRRVLPTHYSLAWTDVLGPELVWNAMVRGALWSAGYAVVLLAWAWWHFERKDITS